VVVLGRRTGRCGLVAGWGSMPHAAAIQVHIDDNIIISFYFIIYCIWRSVARAHVRTTYEPEKRGNVTYDVPWV